MISNNMSFSKDFYSKSAIIRAINDYSKLAKITLSEESNYYICSFNNCVIASERVKHEFSNYLIEVMNSQVAD